MAFPTTSLIDNFNRANENPVSDGSKWTAPLFVGDANLRVNTNRMEEATGAGFGSAYRNDITPGPDCEVYAVASNGSGSGIRELFARMQSPGTTGIDGYFLDINGSTWTIWRVDNNTQTQLAGSATQAYSAGDSIGLEVTGSTLNGYYKAAAGSWSLVLTKSDATYSSAGRVGAVLQDAAAWDDFSGGTISGGAAVTVKQLAVLGVG